MYTTANNIHKYTLSNDSEGGSHMHRLEGGDLDARHIGHLDLRGGFGEAVAAIYHCEAHLGVASPQCGDLVDASTQLHHIEDGGIIILGLEGHTIDHRGPIMQFHGGGAFR